MKIIVTHTSPDWDAITSTWLIRRFLPGWSEALVEFVPAGQRSLKANKEGSAVTDAVEEVGEHELIHVDTGLGPLDHHQTESDSVSAASVTWDYVQKFVQGKDKWEEKKQAISRIVKVVVAIDHFKELYWDNPTADYHEFSMLGVLEGLKLEKPDQDDFYMDFGLQCLDALLHAFENRIWAEREIEENGKQFTTRWGKGIGFTTVNDTVLKLAQKMGFAVVIRKDPRKGYIRIKARPPKDKQEVNIDLTLLYEKLKKMDPQATWFLHVSKKMLLNGTVKNPKMVPTRLSLDDIIKVIESI